MMKTFNKLPYMVKRIISTIILLTTSVLGGWLGFVVLNQFEKSLLSLLYGGRFFGWAVILLFVFSALVFFKLPLGKLTHVIESEIVSIKGVILYVATCFIAGFFLIFLLSNFLIIISLL